MEVNLNNNLEPVGYQRLASKARATTPDASVPDFQQAESLNHAFAATPAVRPEVVARAQRLVNDVTYPPLETVRRIAALLVTHLREE